MKEQDKNALAYTLKVSANYGIFYLLLAFSLYFLGIKSFSSPQGTFTIKYIFFALGMFVAIRNINIRFFENQIKFSKIIVYGIIFGLGFSFFDGFYSAVYYQLEPQYKDLIIKNTELVYQEMQFPQQQIDMAIFLLKKYFVILTFTSAFLINLMVAIFYSLIFAIFGIKKK